MKMFKNKKINNSIRKQIGFVFIALMVFTILVCILINTFFLTKYYMWSKHNIIRSAYDKIWSVANLDNFDREKFAAELDEICTTDNISIYIYDEKTQLKYMSVNGGGELENLFVRYVFGIMPKDYEMLELSEDYCLLQAVHNDNEYIEMFGRLSTGIAFLIRTPVESIKESAALANKFFAYVGIISTLIGAVIIWIVSIKITRPIMELNNISEKMVKLDFDVKYSGTAQNEIGLLGRNMNELSNSLENAISELKTANNELKKDIEKKEQLDEIRKEFLSNVSHELKTPIALIQGYAEGLREGINDDPESKEFYCDVIIDEASKMNIMVKKLLTLNQLEFGNEIVNMERFDIISMIKNYVNTNKILLSTQDIKVNFVNEEEIFVWGDEYKVEEVFINYFTNAINHCEGEKLIEIKVEKIDKAARINVFNSGTPIPENAIDHIWEKFYKVDKARTREYGGSGIGLSIVKAIMESMNQNYGVTNFNNGVNFWFELDLG